MPKLQEYAWESFQDVSPKEGRQVDIVCVVDRLGNDPDTCADALGFETLTWTGTEEILDTHWRYHTP